MARDTAPAANRPQFDGELVRDPLVHADRERPVVLGHQHDLRDDEVAERRDEREQRDDREDRASRAG